MHFGEDGDELMTVESNQDTSKNIAELSFVTDGFSVYAIASQGNGLGDNIFNRQYVLVCNGVAVSPEQNTTINYTQNLRGIPVTVSNETISSSEDELPVWKLNRRWENATQYQQGRWIYWLSTTLNGNTVYLHIAYNNTGTTYVNDQIQELRIETRNNSTQYRFYRTDRGQRPKR